MNCYCINSSIKRISHGAFHLFEKKTMGRTEKESVIEYCQPSACTLDSAEKVEGKERRRVGFVVHETPSSPPVPRPPSRAPRNRVPNSIAEVRLYVFASYRLLRTQAGTPQRHRRLGESICVKLTGEKHKRKLPKHELSYEAHRSHSLLICFVLNYSLSLSCTGLTSRIG